MSENPLAAGEGDADSVETPPGQSASADATPDEPEARPQSDEASPEAARPDGLPLLRWTLPACLLAWLVPGAGHVVAGRGARGALFFLLIMGLFVGGLLLDGQVYRPVPGEPLSYLAAFGASGSGLLYIVTNFLGAGVGDVAARFHEYGNTFTLLAGLLNLLLVLDAYDCAVEKAIAATRVEAVE